MATPRKKPARRGATNQRKKPAKTQASWRVPGWLWGLLGMAAGFFLAQHQHGTAPWQTPPDDSPQATVISKEARDAQEAARETEQAAEPSMPTFEFYTLLPETEVIAPGGAPASSVNRPEATAVISEETAEEQPAVSADDPIAQVIAANSDEIPSRANAPSETPPGRYMLQAASFREFEDAEQLRRRLRNLSLLAQISEVQAGGDTWHRVQVGPYEDTRELNRAQDLMNTQGIEPLLIQLQN
ncbi:SPOR domain-containing protein [Vreelandella massiliensis]|uniref:SPOR domain-containing protein n=1 Tax=Vreelandella massiliensis TaxID=1816686 RepID=UPI00096A30F2|nr:SPOR domain-containing protein [Halomonas massiliensis]MYL22997.1 SPOR domain-containing protein [Halomonas alkaliantarctica]